MSDLHPCILLSYLIALCVSLVNEPFTNTRTAVKANSMNPNGFISTSTRRWFRTVAASTEAAIAGIIPYTGAIMLFVKRFRLIYEETLLP